MPAATASDPTVEFGIYDYVLSAQEEAAILSLYSAQ